MIGRVLKALHNRNLRAELRLATASGGLRSFKCFGKVELELSRNASVASSRPPALVGATLLDATPRTATTRIVVRDGGALELRQAIVGAGSQLVVAKGAKLAIGPRSYLARCHVSTSLEVSIGEDCAISWGVTILDDDGHGFGPPPYSAPIRIEDHVWIGCNATVLKGVVLGTGTVVAAGSVVTRSAPPRSLLAGSPARVVREGVEWTDASRLARPRDA